MKRRYLLLATGAALFAGGAVMRALSGPGFAGRALDADVAHRLATAGDLTLVDIRRPDEWAQTGIGAGALPLDMRRADFTQALAARMDGRRDAPVALICARGVRSARMATRLQDAGFTNVADVPEGMLGSSAGPGWLARGLPVRMPDP